MTALPALGLHTQPAYSEAWLQLHAQALSKSYPTQHPACTPLCSKPNHSPPSAVLIRPTAPCSFSKTSSGVMLSTTRKRDRLRVPLMSCSWLNRVPSALAIICRISCGVGKGRGHSEVGASTAQNCMCRFGGDEEAHVIKWWVPVLLENTSTKLVHKTPTVPASIAVLCCVLLWCRACSRPSSALTDCTLSEAMLLVMWMRTWSALILTFRRQEQQHQQNLKMEHSRQADPCMQVCTRPCTPAIQNYNHRFCKHDLPVIPHTPIHKHAQCVNPLPLSPTFWPVWAFRKMHPSTHVPEKQVQWHDQWPLKCTMQPMVPTATHQQVAQHRSPQACAMARPMDPQHRWIPSTMQ